MDRDESEDSYEEMEEARLRDIEERDAFAGRLKDKDKEKTRQVMSKTEKKVSLASRLCFFILNSMSMVSFKSRLSLLPQHHISISI